MKKTLVKVLSVLCVMALVSVSFAACGSTPSNSTSGSESSAASTDSSTESSTDSSTESSAESTPANTGDLPTITWWLCGSAPANLAEGLDAINAYIADKVGVKLDIQMAGWDDYGTKMNTIVNSGDYFDIMFVNNTNYNRFVNQEKFLDISEMVKTETPDLFSLIPETVWQGTYIGGKSYAVPTYKDSSVTQYFVWDDEYVQKYSIDYENIKTLQDLDAPFRAMKAGEGDTYYPLQLNKGDGFNGVLNNYDDLTLGIPPIGVRVDDTSRKVVSVLEQEDTMADLNLLHSWFNDGIINQDAPTLAEAPKGRPFFSAQAFPGAEVAYQVNDGIEKYVMTQIKDSLYTTSSIQGSLNAISSASKYQKESLKFLELVNTDSQLRNMLAYGIEGVDWVKMDEENVIDRISDTWSLSAYQQGTFFNLAAITPNKGDQYDSVKALNEAAKPSACLGFALDITKLSTEVANCNTIWEKYRYDLLTGASDPAETVPQIIAEMKNNGMDTIMAEAQAQIDAYFADGTAE